MKTTTKTALCVWAFLIFAAQERARAFYDPGSQRWLNRDPATDLGFRTAVASIPAYQEGNLYCFNENRVLEGVDPVGLSFFPGTIFDKDSPWICSNPTVISSGTVGIYIPIVDDGMDFYDYVRCSYTCVSSGKPPKTKSYKETFRGLPGSCPKCPPKITRYSI